ncbi:MAG: hypothetical protein ACE37F_17180 [Nannocystaceae bacterium]|nr:hypothetical protein [bacterium]
MSAAWTALVARWDAAREAIIERVDGVLSQATSVSEPIAATSTTDANALQRLWQSVDAKMSALAGEVSDAWDSISDEMSQVEGIPKGGMWLEGFKRDACTTDIEIRHGRARASIFAKAAASMLRYVQASGDPDARRMFAHGGAVFIAEQAAVENWAGMKTAQTRIRGYRNPKAVPMQLLEYYAKVSANYWRIRYATEAKYNPAQQAGVETKIANFTKSSHALLLEHPQWRAAASS